MELSTLWNNFLYPLFAILIPVLATIYTLNMRLKNENREKHQPYLILSKADTLIKIDKKQYFLTLEGENANEINELKISLFLKNIGYGVATNVKFYNLYDSSQLKGCQELKEEINQQLFTTFDIARDEEKNIQMIIKYNYNNRNMNRILCVYQDLNYNVYNFIIAINIKSKNRFDYFSYQPSSISYQRWLKEYKSHVNAITKKYKDL